jgi:hypothetical protein
MAPVVLTDCIAWVGGYDFTTDSNSLTLDVSVEDKDSTVFGQSGWKSRVGGLKDVTSDLKGLWQSATLLAPDPQAFANLGVADMGQTYAATSTEGSVAYFYQGLQPSYDLFGAVGEIAPFSIKSSCSNYVGAIRGQVTPAKGNVSATGALGAGANLGAVSATQYLYGIFHVLGTPGTTVTAKIESDSTGAFSTPANVGSSFGPITTAGATWVTRTAGAITDTWFRFNVTAITGTFSIAGAIGIGS